MLTQKTKYALKALAELGEEKRRGGGALRIEEIAERSGAPKRFLEHILLDLKRAGLIGSRRGRHGGYELIREAERISVGEVLSLVDGPIAPLACLSRRAYRRCDDCADEKTCRIRHAFGHVFYSYLLLVESMTLADILRDGDALEKAAGQAVSG